MFVSSMSMNSEVLLRDTPEIFGAQSVLRLCRLVRLVRIIKVSTAVQCESQWETLRFAYQCKF